MSVSRRLRYEILRRDGHRCRYCGATAPDTPLTIDHVLPVALGGSDEPTNLVTACAACNSGKAASNPDAPIVENVSDDALRWAAAVQKAAEIQMVDREHRDRYIAAFDEDWSQWTYVDSGDEIARPQGWRDSIGRFHDLGIEYTIVADAMRASMERRTRGKYGAFTYMCGILWSFYDERQEIARGLLATDEDGR